VEYTEGCRPRLTWGIDKKLQRPSDLGNTKNKAEPYIQENTHTTWQSLPNQEGQNGSELIEFGAADWITMRLGVNKAEPRKGCKL
jgi:hypothetical protein